MKEIFSQVKNIIREHYIIIIGSLLLTFLIFAPLIVFPYVIKNDYQGININHFGTDSLFYLTRGREVLDGYSLGNPVLREGKDGADIFFSYSEHILLAPIKLLGLAKEVDIVTLYNTYNFIGVFFLICLIYYLVWQLSGKKLLAITAALFAIGGYSIVYHKALFYNDLNVYARVIYPFVNSIILFLYLNLLVKSLKSIELKYKILAGAFFGLSFYIYLYLWSFVLALNGCLFLIFLFKKDFLQLKKVAFISILGLALGAYNLCQLFLWSISEVGKQMSYFIWASFGHSPIFSKIGFITLIIFAIYYYRRRDDENWPFMLAVILGGWVALNQQIVTGRMLQYGHYYFYFIVPLSIIISFYLVWHLIKSENLKKYLFLILICVVFINTAGGQYKSFFTWLEVKRGEQNYRPIIDFLNRDQRPGVILADLENELLYTIYTSHNLFWHNSATFYNVPIQRFKDTLFTYYYLNKEIRNDFMGYLERIGADRASRGSYYKSLFRNLEGYWSGYDYYTYIKKVVAGDKELSVKRAGVINELNKEYNEIVVKNKGIDGLLKKYGVNYFVWDKNKFPEWDLGVISGLQQVFSYNNIYVYELR
jgi:ABC-type multidrug transport system fused ATPase/permease subunit